MPVIDRPNTDAQRLQAMEAAKLKADVTPAASLAFSADTLARLVAFLPNFNTQVQERGSALSAQAGVTTLADKAKTKLKLFISHFFQVFDFGIAREVYTADQRAHFQLDVNQEALPQLDTEQQIQLWAGRIVTGDAARTAAGGAAMTNPTAAQVEAEQATYVTAQGNQSVKKEAYDTEQEDVAALRPEADDIIADIWDEVEFTFRKDTPPSKRRKAREYGVVYRPRTGETLSPDDFSITGKVTDSNTNLPIEGVAFRVVPPDIILLGDSQGNYFVPVQPAGTYTIQVHKAGYQDKEISGVVVTAGAITTLNIQLIPGVGLLTGMVGGQVLVGAGTQPTTVSVDGTAITTGTDPLGNYALSNVPEGAQVIRAAVNSNPANFQTKNVTVVAGGTVVLNFTFP